MNKSICNWEVTVIVTFFGSCYSAPLVEVGSSAVQTAFCIGS